MTPMLETLARLQATDGQEGFLLLLVLKVTLILLVGFAAALGLRRTTAAGRHFAWCLTFAGLLLLPALAVWTPTWAPALPVPVLPDAPSTPAAAAAAGPAAVDSASDRAPGSALSAALSSDPAGVARTELGADRSGPVLSDTFWSLAPPTLYLLGALGLLALLAAGDLRVRWLRRAGRRLDTEPGWRELLATLHGTLGIRRPVRVFSTSRVAVPLAWGLRRPTVLLPAAAATWGDGQRRDVLLHELAHVARHDWLTQRVARIVCALYWFHPLVWIAARRLVLEAERACDDRVLDAGVDSCDYAERLLRVAGAARAFREPSYATVAMARRSDLATRIQSILDGRVRRGALRALPGLLVAGAILGPLGLVGPLQLAHAERPVAVDRLADSGKDPVAGPELEGAEDLSPLSRVAHDGDLDEVRRLLDAGADPNWIDRLGDFRRPELQRCALGGAARGGHLEVAALLLDRGARVDLTPRGDASPLMIAARHGHASLVDLLLEHGADPSRVVRGDGTPLIAAVRNGEREIARKLLAAGADPDTWVDGDESPLFHAVHAGDRSLVRLLLDAGADPNATWDGDGNALIVAAGRWDEAMIDLLLGYGADPDRGVEGDGNALLQAAGRGDLSAVQRLLAAGADPDAAVRGDGNALIRAAASGHLDVARLLVESGADVDRIVPGDENPLIQAAGGGHLELVRYLLDRGADPDVKVVVPPTEWRPEGDVRTPLSMARRGGHDDVVRLLLDHGATE